MQTITITGAWLHARGGLHDARVLAVELEDATVRMSIDDEWANEHDQLDPHRGGTLVISGATILEGNVAAIEGGWIIEVVSQDRKLVFYFCDRDRMSVSYGAAFWVSGPIE